MKQANYSTEFSETYAYDQKSGRPASVTTIIRHPSIPTQTITYGYDSQGRMVTARHDSYGTAYSYNPRGYRTQIRNTNFYPPPLLQQTLGMDAFGNATEVNYKNGHATVQSYDDASGRPRSIRTYAGLTGSRTVQDLSYQWRTDGALKSRTNHLPATDLKETFTHDSLRRLTRASTRHASGTRNLDYTYDALGNLTAKTSSATVDKDVTGYTRTKTYTLTSVRVGSERLTLTYDAVGNVTAINSSNGNDKTIAPHNLATNIRVSNHGGSRVTEETFESGPDN